MTRDPYDRMTWPDEVDDILGGDLVVAVGSPTPRGGVALYSVTPLGMRDRAAGTVTFTTSLGFGRKLERIAADPRIAVTYHTRKHGHTDRQGVVVVQGIASIRADVSDAERAALTARATEHIGQVVSGRFWDWWLSVYYYDRVLVDVAVRRVLWWPDDSLAHDPVVLGAPLPDVPPAPQEPPRDPTTPRVPLAGLRRSTSRPHLLTGYLLADGMPLAVPVEAAGIDERGLVLGGAAAGILPPGGRRAGFLAHDFRPKLIGLSTTTHTGWLEVDGRARWTPHTRHGFVAPPNKTLLLLGNGAAARWGYRQALRAGRGEVIRHARPRNGWVRAPGTEGAATAGQAHPPASKPARPDS